MRCVIVTGAGASRELGKAQPLPLMGDWAGALRDELNGRVQGLADAIGLRDGMSGQDFERALGTVLRWNDLWPLNEQFRGLGADPIGEIPRGVRTAHRLEGERLQEIMDGINESLFSMFSAAKIDEDLAIDAYGNLLEILGNPDDLIVVTTNYDPAAEIALTGLGRNPDTGFDRPPGRAPTLNPHGLVRSVRQRPDAVGVLHLHGAVGWYENEGVVYEQHQDQPFNDTLGRPVVLYPDPNKDPTRDALVQALWVEFDEALEDATHVLVLGHSLHDPALVAKLRVAAQSSNVAVCTYGAPGEPSAGEPALLASPKEADRILKLVPGKSNVLPVQFGPRSVGLLSGIRQWLLNTGDHI
jgi:hypothetical protein